MRMREFRTVRNFRTQRQSAVPSTAVSVRKFRCACFAQIRVDITAYLNDVRWRIVYHGITINLPLVNIAQDLNVQYCRYRLFEESGTVDPRSPGGSVVGDLIYVVNCCRRYFRKPINVPKKCTQDAEKI